MSWDDGDACGSMPPGVSELACSGAESAPLACPHEAGDGVFCGSSNALLSHFFLLMALGTSAAPSESVVVTCAGDGETQGRPAKEAVPQLGV